MPVSTTAKTPCFASWQSWLAPRGRATARTVASLRQLTLAQIEGCLGAAFPAAWLAQNSAGAHSRERIYTQARTVWCWLWQVLQAHTSCREVVRQVQALFALQGAGHVDPGTAGYCQARSKLPLALLQKLLPATLASAQRAAPTPAQPMLGGRSLRVIDASGAQLADTPPNRALYPPSSNLPAGTGFPYLRVAVLFCLQSGALLAHATGALTTSELRLFVELLPHLRPGEILLADRAYGQYLVAALLQAAGVDFLSTVSRTRRVDFRRAQKRFGPNDALFRWQKGQTVVLDPAAWAQVPDQLLVRLLRVHLRRPGFRAQSFILVTTLLDPVAYPASHLVEAYARRWRLEMSFDDLKTTLGMESLRGQKPTQVQKELLVFLIAHNLLRWLMATAASHQSVALDSISFKGALDSFRQWSHALAQCRCPRQRSTLWQQLLATLAADRLPFRPGRTEPRAVKKRGKYPLLNRPRHLATHRWTRSKRRRMAVAAKRKTRS